MKGFEKSYELAALADEIMPGPHSNLRPPMRVKPIFMDKGKGARLWDVDGNEYIDYVCGYGPGLFGYGNDEFTEQIVSQVKNVYFLSTGDYRTENEVKLAGKIVQHVPGVEKVRFMLSGTETVQLAIRLARAYTGRKYILRFESHYHGWMDNVMGGVVDRDPKGKPYPKAHEKEFFKSLGKAEEAEKQSLLIKWNDFEILKDVVEKYGEEIALILMEPIHLNAGCCFPESGYLENVRKLCDDHGIVLCFDEVQTGFRVGLSGAQGLLGVTPDLTTFGKSMGGGIPVGAVGGKKEIMDLLYERKVVGAGTFNGYPLGIAAGLATLTLLEKDNFGFHRKLSQAQNKLISGIKEVANKKGISVFTQGPTGLFFLAISDVDEIKTADDLSKVDWKTQSKFEISLGNEKVLVVRGGRWFVSGGLTDQDIEQTISAVNTVLDDLM